MNYKHLLAILCLLAALLITPAAAAGGSGTPADPYIIQTATELQSMQNDLGASYKLANNIDLSGVTWTPIGTTTAGFHGTLDGNGKTISNLVLSTSTQSTGLFGSLTSGATIKDLTFADCSVTSTSPWCGVVIGSIIMSAAAHDTAILDNVDCVRCTVQSGTSSVGCLVGLIYTASVVDIIDCDMSYCNAESTGSYSVGCLVGSVSGQSETEMTDSTVIYSHAKAGSHTVGCLVGTVADQSGLVMTNCVAENSIAESTGSYNVGCLVGYVAGQSAFAAEGCIARNCIAKAATNYAGGVLGRVVDAGSTAAIKNCDVDRCTIVASSSYAGGVLGRVQTGTTGIVTGCDVTNCTILASSYAAGICPAYS